MKKYLVTGIKSGLGKYLYENLSDAAGLDRSGFNLIKDEEYDTIIHCAFNKAQTHADIGDHYGYLEDCDWVSPEEKLKAIELDSVWELQWYPDTPIGSYYVAASSLEAIQKHMMENGNAV